jgi:hypothetical protein
MRLRGSPANREYKEKVRAKKNELTEKISTLSINPNYSLFSTFQDNLA